MNIKKNYSQNYAHFKNAVIFEDFWEGAYKGGGGGGVTLRDLVIFFS